MAEQGKTAKQMGIPVEERFLASDTGRNAVWIKETLPPFSVYTKNGLRIDVPGIPLDELRKARYQDNSLLQEIELSKMKGRELPKSANIGTDKNGNQIKKDSLKDVFEGYLRQQPNCPKDIDFVFPSLENFYCEYSWLDGEEANISSMVRSAMNDGIHFEFYEKTPEGETAVKFGTKSVGLDDANAQYASSRRAIAFNCESYPHNNKDHNTLAHELCHYAMDDRGTGGYLCTFVESDFGKMWFNALKDESFLGNKCWEKYGEEHKLKTGKILYGSHPFWKNLSHQYGLILKGKSYKSEGAKIGEMFARVMGLLAKKRSGLDSFSNNHIIRSGVDIVCRMAQAKANGDMDVYNGIVTILKEHKITPESKEAMFDCANIRDEVRERNTFTERDYNEYMKTSLVLSEKVMSESSAILEKMSKLAIDNNEKIAVSQMHKLLAQITFPIKRMVSVTSKKIKDGEEIDVTEKKEITTVKKERYKKTLPSQPEPLSEYPLALRTDDKSSSVIQNFVKSLKQK